MNINEFLVKHYRLSQEESIAYMQQHDVLINDEKANQRQKIDRRDRLIIDGCIVREINAYRYYAFYKPRGIECTLNPGIADNLLSILPFKEHVYPIGRLDKESEGLLILTNDGRLYKDIAFADRFKEKEYEVSVDHVLTEYALSQLSQGIVIKGQRTRPALVRSIDDTHFNIVLTQGINRQIRRMCYKLGYEVITLKRVRIEKTKLGLLQPGEYEQLARNEIE